jgi:hypothetical protein
MGVNAHLCPVATPTSPGHKPVLTEPLPVIEPRASTQPRKLTTRYFKPSSGHRRLGGCRTSSVIRANGLVGLARGGVDWAWRGHAGASGLSLTSQVHAVGGSLAGNEHSPISSTVDPRCFLALSRDGRAAVSNVRTVASPEGVISIKVCSGLPAWCVRTSPRMDESKQQSHLSGGVLTALKHAQYPVECGVRPGHRRVAG